MSQVQPDGKYVVDLSKDLKMEDIRANLRVALTNDAYTLHKILPSKALPPLTLLAPLSRSLCRWIP